MRRELIFLVSAAPKEVEPEIELLCRMKVTNEPEANPLVAFSTEELGRQLIAGRKLDDFCTLMRFSELPADQAEKSKKQRVLLFEWPEQIRCYLQDGERFDFAQQILEFSDAERRLETAS